MKRARNRRKIAKLGFLCFLLPLSLIDCTAPPIQLKCQEIRMRMNNAETEDQRRFSALELVECENRLESAINQDSSSFQRLEKRFTPIEDSL